MQQADDRRKARRKVKPQGDIGQHQHSGQQHADHGVAHQRSARDRADIAGGGGFGIHVGIDLRQLGLQAVLQVLDFLIAAERGHADLHHMSLCAGGRNGELADALIAQSRFHIGLVKGGAHIVLNIEAAREVNAIVDAIAQQRHHQSGHQNGGGNAQADTGALLNFHITSPPLQQRRLRRV